MSELLNAAKAVIQDLHDLNYERAVNLAALEDAIEQVEKKKDINFDNWVFDQDVDNCGKIGLMELAWQAAKQTERQRLITILYNTIKDKDTLDKILEQL